MYVGIDAWVAAQLSVRADDVSCVFCLSFWFSAKYSMCVLIIESKGIALSVELWSRKRTSVLTSDPGWQRVQSTIAATLSPLQRMLADHKSPCTKVRRIPEMRFTLDYIVRQRLPSC